MFRLKNLLFIIPFLFGNISYSSFTSFQQKNIQNPLSDFLFSALEIDTKENVLIPFEPASIADGGAINKLFMLQNKKDKTIAFIKVIPSKNDEKNLGFGEWQALEKLQHLHLHHHKPVKLYGFGEFEIDGMHYTAIVIEPASGKSLYTYIEAVAKEPLYSLSRKKALNLLKKAISLTANVYKQLHDKHPTFFISNDYYQRNETLFKLYLEKKGSRAPKDLSDQFKKSLPKGGWIHGDAHPGNIFVDVKKQTVTLIDVSDMYSSIKKEDEGGPIVEDYASLLYFLDMMGKKTGLEEKEIDLAKNTFIDAYGSTSFDELSLTYYNHLLSAN